MLHYIIYYKIMYKIETLVISTNKTANFRLTKYKVAVLSTV